MQCMKLFSILFFTVKQSFSKLFIFYMITTITMNKVSLFCTCLAKTCNWLITKITETIDQYKNTSAQSKNKEHANLLIQVLAFLGYPLPRCIQKRANPPTAYFTTQPFTAACRCKQVGQSVLRHTTLKLTEYWGERLQKNNTHLTLFYKHGTVLQSIYICISTTSKKNRQPYRYILVYPLLHK